MVNDILISFSYCSSGRRVWRKDPLDNRWSWAKCLIWRSFGYDVNAPSDVGIAQNPVPLVNIITWWMFTDVKIPQFYPILTLYFCDSKCRSILNMNRSTLLSHVFFWGNSWSFIHWWMVDGSMLSHAGVRVEEQMLTIVGQNQFVYSEQHKNQQYGGNQSLFSIVFPVFFGKHGENHWKTWHTIGKSMENLWKTHAKDGKSNGNTPHLTQISSGWGETYTRLGELKLSNRKHVLETTRNTS